MCLHLLATRVSVYMFLRQLSTDGDLPRGSETMTAVNNNIIYDWYRKPWLLFKENGEEYKEAEKVKRNANEFQQIIEFARVKNGENLEIREPTKNYKIYKFRNVN